jgi:hypothetical protein
MKKNRRKVMSELLEYIKNVANPVFKELKQVKAENERLNKRLGTCRKGWAYNAKKRLKADEHLKKAVELLRDHEIEDKVSDFLQTLQEKGE